LTARSVASPRRSGRFGWPHLGYGVGLRAQHYRDALEAPRSKRADWLELISENFLATGGRPLEIAERAAERHAIVLHGVSLSIGSADPLDRAYLRELRDLAERVRAAWIGDHVCWTGVGGRTSHELLPLPYTEAALAHVVARTREVQDFLGRPLVLENPSTYATFRSSTMEEPEFLARLAEEADCALLLDVNNVHVTCRNHDRDPRAYLAALPHDRVVQIHVAGHTDRGTHLLDSHVGPVPAAVWELYAEAIRLGGPKSTSIEWDSAIPDFATVRREALRARRVAESVARPAGAR
jgi:uncharacterized protein (UPF0276 family)